MPKFDKVKVAPRSSPAGIVLAFQAVAHDRDAEREVLKLFGKIAAAFITAQ